MPSSKVFLMHRIYIGPFGICIATLAKKALNAIM
jgi:hypothetical protein